MILLPYGYGKKYPPTPEGKAVQTVQILLDQRPYSASGVSATEVRRLAIHT
jgi:hypothetical protein